MQFSSAWRLALAVALLALAAQPGRADPPSNVTLGGMLAKPPPKPQMPDAHAPPVPWPRLDPGAVLCRSEADLLRRAEAMRGEQAGPADCHVINVPAGIQIVQRSGPGRTEVKVSSSNETGWTDAWLPATPPPGANVSNAH